MTAANDNTAEVWRAIPSLPEYIASSHGRIMRVPYLAGMPHGGLRSYGGEPYQGVWNETDRRFTLQFRGRNYKVARLVCEAFHGAAPPDKQVCMHLDEDSRNNRPENLAWGSQKENLNALGFIAYCKGRTGDSSPWRKGQRAKAA